MLKHSLQILKKKKKKIKGLKALYILLLTHTPIAFYEIHPDHHIAQWQG